MYLFLQKNFLQKTGYAFLLAGFILHTVSIIFAFMQAGHIPATNLRDTLCLAGWAIAGVFLVVQFDAERKSTARFSRRGDLQGIGGADRDRQIDVQ